MAWSGMVYGAVTWLVALVVRQNPRRPEEAFCLSLCDHCFALWADGGSESTQG